MKKNPEIAILVLRLGLAFVLVWFGTSQLQHPAQWISYLPHWISSLPISATSFVLMNGLLEIVGALLLALGAWTRLAALLLGLHLLGIVFSLGYSAVAIRDVGLAIALLSIAIGGAGSISVDAKSKIMPNTL